MTQNQPTRSPKRHIWLILLTGLMMLYQIVWIVRVLHTSDRLREQLALSVPLEIAITLVLLSLFTSSIYALMMRLRLAVRYTIGVYLGFFGIGLLRLVIFAQADYDRQRLAILLIFIGIVSCLVVLPYLSRQLHKSIKGDKSV